MFYSQYSNDKARRDSRRSQLEKQRQKENATVTIRDLVVFPESESESQGESNFSSVHLDIDSTTRLIDHLKSLAKIANEYHQQAYCQLTEEGKYQLKEEYNNTITRLSLNEFSLYGKKPLTLDEFNQVVQTVQQIAQNSHDNVHLLLSSFGVIDNRGKLLNIALYVQGGENAKVDVVTKGKASLIDVRYRYTNNFSQQPFSRDLSITSAYIATEKSSGNSMIVSNNSVFEVETKGGAKYTQAIDICLDHANQHSKRLMLAQQNFSEIDTTHFIPKQVDQILTSNSINPQGKAKITPSILHIDPNPKIFFDRDNTKRPIDKALRLDSSSLLSIQVDKYKSMMATSCSDGLKVTDPPFGSNYQVKVHQERQLGTYTRELKPQIQNLNNRIMGKRLDNMLAARHGYGDKAYQGAQLATDLLQKLYQQSQPNFFEYLFQTRNYVLKNKARTLIEDSTSIFTSAHIDQADFVIAALPWAKDMQLKLAHLDQGLPHHFLKKMNDSIEDFKKQANELSLGVQPAP